MLCSGTNDSPATGYSFRGPSLRHAKKASLLATIFGVQRPEPPPPLPAGLHIPVYRMAYLVDRREPPLDVLIR